MIIYKLPPVLLLLSIVMCLESPCMAEDYPIVDTGQ